MKWDLFLSHASEDKDFATPLAAELERRGLRVWYDNAVLRVGRSLRRSIDEGLGQSTFGVVIISPHFLAKEWPQKELDGLVAREADGTSVILPVWHNITAAGVRQYSPTLADRFAVSSSKGVEIAADAIVASIRGVSQYKGSEAELPEVIAHLSLEDSRVLRLACEQIVQSDEELIGPEDIEAKAAELGIDGESLLDSIEILGSEGLVESSGAVNKRVVGFRVTPRGFGIYARQFVPDYESVRKQVAQAIVDKDLWRSPDIAEAVSREEAVVKFVLRELEEEGSLTLSNEVSRHELVNQIHPRLKRFARS